jgi:DNA-binding response OmpR family regulator
LTNTYSLDDDLAMAAILVIDDDPDMRDMLKATLEGAGHGVSLATDGRKGVEMYRARQADLVITDLFMPDQEGIETIKQMRMEFPEVPIIAISGKPTGGTMLTVAQRLGAKAVLQKPFLPDELLKMVEETL